MKEMSNAAAERAAAQQALKRGELKERETYTAKQVAMRCGTDAKTMRKFFRSSFSSTEAVGQGGRYEFDAKDMPKIKKEFREWLTRKTVKRPKAASEISEAKSQAAHRRATAKAVAEEDPEVTEEQVLSALEDQAAQEIAGADDFGDDPEPTEEELMELEKMMEEGGI